MGYFLFNLVSRIKSRRTRENFRSTEPAHPNSIRLIENDGLFKIRQNTQKECFLINGLYS